MAGSDPKPPPPPDPYKGGNHGGRDRFPLALAPTHYPWCARELHQASGDPDQGPTAPCLSITVDAGDAFAYLDGGPGNAQPRLVEVVPPSHGGFTADTYRTWRAGVDALAEMLVTPGKSTKPVPPGTVRPPRPGWGGR